MRIKKRIVVTQKDIDDAVAWKKDPLRPENNNWTYNCPIAYAAQRAFKCKDVTSGHNYLIVPTKTGGYYYALDSKKTRAFVEAFDNSRFNELKPQHFYYAL